MSALKKGDKAIWKHVPAGGGYGYASPEVTVLAVLESGKWVKIEAMTKDGSTRQLTIKGINISPME